MPRIKFQTKDGSTHEMDIRELIAVDGRPYQSAAETDGLKERLAFFEGRLTAIEAFLATQLEAATNG